MKANAGSEFTTWLARAQERYRTRNPISAGLYQKASRYLPGGNTRTVMHYPPYPVHIVRGEGFRLFDADGHSYLDFINNYTSLIHGNAHPDVVAAANKQTAEGVCFPGPHESQTRLAELICARVGSVDQIRFCNSGTEATMHAIRAARAYTKKRKVIKVEGGYHGTHDLAEVSVHPDPDKVGPSDAPRSVPENRGIAPSTCNDVVVIPFNNPEVAERVLSEQASDAACLIVEPLMGGAGLIPPEPNYLETLRELTSRSGVLLIFDEVITFRLSPGGFQGILGLKPDLTAFGKIIGGGFPVGAFGGSKEIMRLYSPLEKDGISHSGTFNGNPVTMAAGLAAMNAYTPEVIDRINALGQKLRDGLDQALVRQGVKGVATGLGSLAQVHFTPHRVTDYRSAHQANKEVISLIHLLLLERGVYMAPRGLTALSTPMTGEVIEAYIEAFEDSVANIKPFIQSSAADLLV